MAENLSKKPSKSILKTSSSFDHTEVHKTAPKPQPRPASGSTGQQENRDIKWDEMNILQTLHPPGKDYGHMKILEPKTPYSYSKDDADERGSDTEGEALDAELLAKKISLGSDTLPKALKEEPAEAEEDEYANLTEEEKAKKKAFEYKRKMHYNEYYAVKLAKKLMKNDEDEDEDDGAKKGGPSKGQKSAEDEDDV